MDIIDPSKLHKRTYCPRCMKNTEEILVIDAALTSYKCPICDMGYLGSLPSVCEKCGNSTYGIVGKPLADLERIPQLCDECIREMKDFFEEVKMGGVYWDCKCGRKGVIHAKSEFAKDFRKKVGIAAPAVCGVHLEVCPECKKRGFSDGSED